MLPDVVSHLPIWYLLQHHRERRRVIGNPKELNDVGMRQPFLHSNLFVKELGSNHQDERLYCQFDFVSVLAFVNAVGLAATRCLS